MLEALRFHARKYIKCLQKRVDNIMTYHRENQVISLLYAKKNLLLSLGKVNIQEKGNHETARSAGEEIRHTKNKCRCSHATMLVGIGGLASPINCNLFTHHTHALSLGIMSPCLHVHFSCTS